MLDLGNGIRDRGCAGTRPILERESYVSERGYAAVELATRGGSHLQLLVRQ